MNARRRGGWLGAEGVWWPSMHELCRIASPEVVSRRGIPAPFLMHAVQGTDLSASISLPQHGRPSVEGHQIMKAQIYSLLLTLCPVDMRREFGAGMTQVFLEDLEEHRRRFGFYGVVRVWRRSLGELCGLALGEAFAERQFLAPLIVYTLLQIWFGFEYLMRTGNLPSPEQLILSNPLLSPGWIPATVAFLAVRAAYRNAPIVLKLERR